MNFIKTPIDDLLVAEPNVFKDDRGYFFESYQKLTFELNGIELPFIQDNQSYSKYGVLRGMHFQTGKDAQAKLVRVLVGSVLDVAVDLRPHSKTFMKYFSIELSAENKKQLYIPRGFAHGFVVLSEVAEFFYKCDNFYKPSAELGFRFDDKEINIDWKIDSSKLIVAEKDKSLLPFNKIRALL